MQDLDSTCAGGGLDCQEYETGGSGAALFAPCCVEAFTSHESCLEECCALPDSYGAEFQCPLPAGAL